MDVWLDKEKLLPGEDWELEIRKAVHEADVVVVCLSNQFNQAGFRQKEVQLALDTAVDQPEGEIFIIPARLEECDVPESLGRWQWVDLFEVDGFQRIIRALRMRADKINAKLRMRKSVRPITSPPQNKETKKTVEPHASAVDIPYSELNVSGSRGEEKPATDVKQPGAGKRRRKLNNPFIVSVIGVSATILTVLIVGLAINRGWIINPFAMTGPTPTPKLSPNPIGSSPTDTSSTNSTGSPPTDAPSPNPMGSSPIGTSSPNSNAGGGRIIFARKEGDGRIKMYSMKPDGSNVTYLFDATAITPENLSWSADGKHVAYALNGKLNLLNLDTNTKQTLADAYSFVAPIWSPDGKKLSFVGPSDANPGPRVYNGPNDPDPGLYSNPWVSIIGVDGNGLIGHDKKSTIEQTGSQVAWMPDGRAIVFESGWSQRRPYFYKVELGDLSKYRFQTELGLYKEKLLISSDGARVLAYNNFDFWFYIFEINQDTSKRLDEPNCHKDVPTWSPDGKWLTVASPVSRQCDQGNLDIFLLDINTGSTVNLTNSPKDDYSASWSPDGKTIAFVSERDGNKEIYVMNADGTGQRNITDSSKDEWYPIWFP